MVQHRNEFNLSNSFRNFNGISFYFILRMSVHMLKRVQYLSTCIGDLLLIHFTSAGRKRTTLFDSNNVQRRSTDNIQGLYSQCDSTPFVHLLPGGVTCSVVNQFEKCYSLNSSLVYRLVELNLHVIII